MKKGMVKIVERKLLRTGRESPGDADGGGGSRDGIGEKWMKARTKSPVLQISSLLNFSLFGIGRKT